MSTEHLDRLLDRLNQGDVAATEQIFRTYEPYLQMLVRRKLRPALRAKFDSMDVVQSVWADVLEGIQGAGWQFEDSNHLQAFLVRLTRNRFIDRCRKHRGALAREEPLWEDAAAESISSDQPRPSEVAQGDELWDQMLELCRPAHRDLLRLKRQGLSLAELAARTGLHPSSIRRIFYELAQQVAVVRERPPKGLVR